jgi:ketosteroid isomerase-like protein
MATKKIPVIINEKLLPENAETMANYYKYAALGDFKNTLDTLSEDIFFDISGDPAALPFAGLWAGKEKVKELFTKFGSSFRLLSLIENQVAESNHKIHSFNDESFFVYRTNRFYRVPVLHTLTFDENHKIASLVNIHDTTAAISAFSGGNPEVIPINSNKSTSAPSVPKHPQQIGDPNQYQKVLKISQDLLDLVFKGIFNSNSISEKVELYIPGKPNRDLISGVWTGDELQNSYPKSLTVLFNSISAKPEAFQIAEIILDNNQLVLEGKLVGENNSKWVILALLNEDQKASSISLYLDFENL